MAPVKLVNKTPTTNMAIRIPGKVCPRRINALRGDGTAYADRATDVCRHGLAADHLRRGSRQRYWATAEWATACGRLANHQRRTVVWVGVLQEPVRFVAGLREMSVRPRQTPFLVFLDSSIKRAARFFSPCAPMILPMLNPAKNALRKNIISKTVTCSGVKPTALAVGILTVPCLLV
jgi:hypothetical protein